MICVHCNKYKVHSFYTPKYCSKQCFLERKRQQLESSKEEILAENLEKQTVKALTVDQAWLIIAKNAIVRRNNNPAELDKFAKMVGFKYTAISELTVGNAVFVDKVADAISRMPCGDLG